MQLLQSRFKLDPEIYDAQRQACAKTWNDLLNQGTVVETPEAVVNNAWRATVIGNYMLLSGDEMRYSAGQSICQALHRRRRRHDPRDVAVRPHSTEAKKLMPPQFAYTRKGLEFHQAAVQASDARELLCACPTTPILSVTIRASWQKEIDVIVKGRQTDNGMFPREKYCGDIDTRVFSLNSNSNCWRAARHVDHAGGSWRNRAIAETRFNRGGLSQDHSRLRSTRRRAAMSIRRSCRSRCRAKRIRTIRSGERPSAPTGI